MEQKITKKNYYEQILAMLNPEDTPDLVNFITHEIELIDTKSAKARAARAEKKEKGDPMLQFITNLLEEKNEEWMSIEDVVELVPEEYEPTKSKVVSRLSLLVRNEFAEKAKALNENKKAIIVYRKRVEE